MLPSAKIPIIDMGPTLTGDAAQQQAVADRIADACARVGFFYVINHGIARDSVDAIFKAAADFHNLPEEAKMEVSVTKNNHFQGYLHGMTKGNDAKISENLQEAFSIRRPLAPDDPDLLAGTPMHGMIPWPKAMPDLQPRMMAYYHNVDALGRQLLNLFEMSLDLPKSTFTRFFKKDMNQLRLLHYPPQAPDGPGDHLGARAHTDTDAFTILTQDMNGGLEVRNKDGDWLAVPPVQDTFVINVGEILKVWTDGIFSSTPHRVINRSGRRRYSIPFFMFPTYDEVIYPILRNPDPANVAPEDLPTSMPRDKPFIWGEFKARNSARILPQKAN
jgi:isopenicillin N synthase-like dioxygenase